MKYSDLIQEYSSGQLILFVNLLGFINKNSEGRIHAGYFMNMFSSIFWFNFKLVIDDLVDNSGVYGNLMISFEHYPAIVLCI